MSQNLEKFVSFVFILVQRQFHVYYNLYLVKLPLEKNGKNVHVFLSFLSLSFFLLSARITTKVEIEIRNDFLLTLVVYV